MIYIQQDKENMNPNIIIHNTNELEFTDKLKKYPQSISENVSIQLPKNKISSNRFQHSKNKKLKMKSFRSNISELNSKQWKKSILSISDKQSKLVQKIQCMLQKQSFKPSNLMFVKKHNRQNTLATQYNISSVAQIGKIYNISSNSYNKNKNTNKQCNIQHKKSPCQKTCSLSQLINLSKVSTISNKTLYKYLLCCENKNNLVQNNHKISQFNPQTQRTKQIVQSKMDQKYDKLKIEIQSIFQLIKLTKKSRLNSSETQEMLRQIRKFVIQVQKKNISFINQPTIQQSPYSLHIE